MLDDVSRHINMDHQKNWKCFALIERASSMNLGKVPVRIA
jgi:hypothetical protein